MHPERRDEMKVMVEVRIEEVKLGSKIVLENRTPVFC